MTIPERSSSPVSKRKIRVIHPTASSPWWKSHGLLGCGRVMGSTRICTGLTMVGLLTGAQVLAESGRGPWQDPSSQPAAENAGRYWPQWRGPMATGVATRADPPVEWSETRNIRWKISLPGTGIVWGDQVFLTAAVPYGDSPWGDGTQVFLTAAVPYGTQARQCPRRA